MNRSEYPENEAVEVWERDGAVFSIVNCSSTLLVSYRAPYNGYVRFPRRPVKELGYRGILAYAPVHGGITYASESEDGSMVYGFDCGHAHDTNNEQLFDIEWVKAECQRMAQAISIAAAYEDEYLEANSAKRADVLESYHERLRQENIDFNLSDNFGAMINVMFGDL